MCWLHVPQAAAVKAEYLQLKEARADLQDTKRALMELQADAQLVRATCCWQQETSVAD